MKNLIYTMAFLLFVVLFTSCNKNKKVETEKKSISNKEIKSLAMTYGEEIAATTQKALGSKLQSVVKTEGIRQALKYCNVNAYPLTDSIKEIYSAEIKRATLKVRNPEDAPTKFETDILNKYQEQMNKGITPKPGVYIKGDYAIFTKPIVLNADICLKCHGEIGTDITEKNYSIIKALYPDDNATGHKIGDMRGIWSISFKKEDLTEINSSM